MYMSALRREERWSSDIFHELPVVVDEKYQCRGFIYSCTAAWRPRNTGKEHLSPSPRSLVELQVELVVRQVELVELQALLTRGSF